MATAAHHRRDRRRRRWRSGPRNVGEVEEIQKVRLSGVTIRQVRVGTDEAVLNELDDRGVIDRRVRDIMPTRERRDYKIRQSEAKLGGESLLCNQITSGRPRPTGFQIAVRRSEEHTSELQSLRQLVCRLLLEKERDLWGRGAVDRHQGLIRPKKKKEKIM